MSFHPAQFNIVHKDREGADNSFVGVRQNGDECPSFVLPPGFDAFPASDPEVVSKYFFALFRALRLFRDFYIRYHTPFDESDFGGHGGMEIDIDRSEPAMLYSKIRVLEKVIERYDELRIYNVLYRNRRSDEVDYSQIHRYLDQAIYQNDVPYVEEMRLAQPAIEMDTTTLVRMFCYIYAQIAPRIDGELALDIQAEAARFKSRKLSPDSRLFREVDVHERTIERLKEVLNEIDREVPHKSAGYWYFFEAIEQFLYGRLDEQEDGVSWGITQFAPVWEDMCQVWMHENRWDGVLYADSKRYANAQIDGHNLFVDENFSPPFGVELGGHTRYMRPDIVSKVDQSAGRLLDITSLGGANVKVSVTKRTDAAKYFLEQLRSKVGQVTHDTKDQRWSYTFYGLKKKNMKNEIRSLTGGGTDRYRVADLKCVPSYFYGKGELRGKARRDERKQLTYEHALQLDGHENTTSQFWLPNYYAEPIGSIGSTVDKKLLNEDLLEADMDVLKVDFETVLGTYLSYDHAT